MAAERHIVSPAASGLWQRLRRQRTARWSLRILYVLLFFAVFGDFIANEKPLYCRIDGEGYFPVLRSYAVGVGLSQWEAPLVRIDDWRTLEYERVVFAPIPYSARTIDLRNSQFRSPFDEQRLPADRFRHLLGTDELGRDVAAGLVAGCRVALLVGLVAMGIAGLIGLLLGGLAGFFGDHQLRIPLIRLLLVPIGIVLGLFWAFVSRSPQLAKAASAGTLPGALLLSLLIGVGAIGLFWVLSRLLEGIPGLGRRVRLPVDSMVLRSIELVQSIPALLLLLCVAAIIQKPDIFYVMVLIGLLSWTGVARFVRSELMHIREMEYIDAARVMGFSQRRILWRHALPNALGPVLITLAFGIASAILVEAALSFLGIGASPDQVTWGSMLSMARRNFTAWWLAILPGLAIFVTVTIFNLLGQGLTDAMDRR